MCLYVYIIGKPAAGKTTVAELLINELGLMTSHYISMDAAHRVLCPRGVASDRYYYTTEGQLFLRDRGALIEEALVWMRHKSDEVAATAFAVPVILVELFYPDYCHAFSVIGPTTCDCIVIDVRSDSSAALMRNTERRPVERVPEEFMARSLEATEFRGGCSGWTVDWHIVNNDASRSLMDLHREIRQIASALSNKLRQKKIGL